MHFVLASAALSKLALSFDNMIQLDSVGFSWIQLWPECHVGGASCKVVLSACQRGISGMLRHQQVRRTVWVRLSYETREVDLDLDYCT